MQPSCAWPYRALRSSLYALYTNLSAASLQIYILTHLIFQIPETPCWLLSKNRRADALKSLQWLRGWVPADAVLSEFNEIVRCSEMSNACKECRIANTKCQHPPPSVGEKMHDLVQIGTRRPFYLLTMAFFVTQFSGLSAIRPFLVQIFQAFAVPMDPNLATVFFVIFRRGQVLIDRVLGCTCPRQYFGKYRVHVRN